MTRLLSAAILIVLAFTCRLAPADERAVSPGSEKNILLIASYNLSDAWTKQLAESTVQHAMELLPDSRFDVISLNALRAHRQDPWSGIPQTYLSAIRGEHYAMIVTLDDVALDALLEHTGEIPPGIPVVFAGYENTTADLKNRRPNLTGIEQRWDCGRAIHIGLSLFPRTRNVLLLCDPRHAREKLDGFRTNDQCPHKDVAISVLPETVRTPREIFAYVETMPKDTLVLFAPWREICDEYHSMQAFSTDLAQTLNRPYLISLDTLFGYGALGGVGSSVKRTGEQTAQLIRRVFDTGSAVDIPISAGDSVVFFDYNVMAANKLDFNVLPAGTTLYNLPPPLWLRPEVYWALGACGVLLLIGGMFAYILITKKTLRLRYELFNELPGRIFVANRSGDLLYLNNGARKKYPDSRFKKITDLPEINHEKLIAAIRQTMDSGERTLMEYSAADSKRMIVMSRLRRHLFGEDAVVWVSLDNTELQNERIRTKEYAAKLERNMKLWNALLHTLPVHVFAKNPDDHFNYVFCNKEIENFFHLGSDRIIGRNDAELFPQKPAAEIAELDRSAVNAGKGLIEQTVSMADANGSIHFFHSLKRLVNLDENERMLLGVAVDITELENQRRENEKAKRRAEEVAARLRLTLDSIGDGVIVSDLHGNIVMLNPVAERMTGYGNGEAAGKPHEQIFKIFSANEDATSPSPLRRALRTGNIVELANHTELISKSGERHHVSDSAAPIRDQDGTIVGAILVFRDVTEEYRQRDHLRRAVTMMEAGAEATHAAVFFCDVQAGKMISGSKLLTQLLPCADGRMPDTPDWVIPEDRRKMTDAWMKLKSGEADSFLVDYRVMKDGEVRYHRMSSFLEERCHDVLRTFGVVQDVTDITRNAVELKNITALWERALQLIPVIFCVKDAGNDFRYVTCNQRYSEIAGIAAEEIAGHTDRELFGSSPMVDEWMQHNAEVVKSHSPLSYEEHIIDRNGERRYLHTFLNVAEIDGKTMLLCAATDITDLRRRLELEEAGNRILNYFIAGNSLDGLYDYIAGELLSHIESGLVVLAGCDRERHAPQFIREWPADGADNDRTAPAAWNFDGKAWQSVIEQLRYGKPVAIDDLAENGMTPPSQRTLHSAAAVPIIEADKMCGFLLVATEGSRNVLNEIDESMMQMCANVMAMAKIRDLQQRQLQEALTTKQVVLDNIRIPIGLYDAHGELLVANREAGRILGKASSGITMETIRSMFKGQNHERTVIRALRTGTSETQEASHAGRDYIINAEPVFDDRGKITNVVQSAYDVTELNALLRKQEIIAFCLDIFFRNDDLESALQAIMAKVCEYLQASRFFIVKYDHASHTSVSFLEHSAIMADPVMHELNMSLYDGTWYQKFRRGETLVITDISNSENEKLLGGWLKIFKDRNVCSIYNAALRLNEDLWGDFGVLYENSPHDFSRSELDFLDAMGTQINLLLQKYSSRNALVKALADTRKSEREKNRILKNEKTLNACLSTLAYQNDSVDKAINTMLQALNEHFGSTRSYILQISNDRRTQSVSHECVKSRMKRVFDPEDRKPFSPHTPWFVKLEKTGVFFMSDLNDPKTLAQMGEWRDAVPRLDMHAVYTAAIHSGDRIWGLFGIMYQGDDRADFSTRELEDMLRSVARLIEILLQRKQIHDRLVEAMELAKAADKAKSFFIASISHEIRTPLNAIIGFAELLRTGEFSQEELTDYLRSISYSGNALLGLINDVLDLSKLEANQLQIVLEPTDFLKLAEDVMRIFTVKAREKNLTLKFKIPPLPMLQLDKLRIRQILLNLIGNAVKFTNAGTITLSAEYKDNETGEKDLSFMVSDTGIGISEADSQKLMDPFVQLNNMRGTNAANNGTGLGLAISKRLAERMNGEIWLKSRVGSGSTFGVTLHGIQAAAGECDAPEKWPSPADVAPSAVFRSILLVDDVPVNLKVLSAMCRKAGLTDIIAVESGAAALAALAERPFSVILTDLWMPEMNGAELARKVHSLPGCENFPVFAVTADVEAKDNFDTSLFAGILLKPVTLEKLRGLFAATPAAGKSDCGKRRRL